MATSKNHKSECAPFICCGAVGVSFDHEPGEPTSIDKFFDAVKHLFSGEHRPAKTAAPQGKVADRRTAAAHGYGA